MTTCTEFYQPASTINPAVLRLRVWPLMGGGGCQEKDVFQSLSSLGGFLVFYFFIMLNSIQIVQNVLFSLTVIN